jgi:hypothetical protein
MQKTLSLSIAIYFLFYCFESVIRYGFHLIGHDEFIFIRDIILGLPLLTLCVLQIMRREVHPAYIVYAVLILLHGMVMMLNIGSMKATFYGIKLLMSMLAGAVLADRFFRPSRRFVYFFLFLWVVTFIGVMLDKYLSSFPGRA